jgi:hypothetical protein
MSRTPYQIRVFVLVVVVSGIIIGSIANTMKPSPPGWFAILCWSAGWVAGIIIDNVDHNHTNK